MNSADGVIDVVAHAPNGRHATDHESKEISMAMKKGTRKKASKKGARKGARKKASKKKAGGRKKAAKRGGRRKATAA